MFSQTISENMNRATNRYRTMPILALIFLRTIGTPTLHGATVYRVIYYNQNYGTVAVTQLDANHNPSTIARAVVSGGSFTQIVGFGPRHRNGPSRVVTI